MARQPDDANLTRDDRRRRSEAAILAAARHQFGQCGFARTTIRNVAARAGVDPALVMQHFGSKEALFAAAAHCDVQSTHVLNAPASELAHAALQDVFSQFERPEDRAATVALMRNCLTHPQAAAMMRDEVLSAAMVATVSRIGIDEAELRSALFSACVMGLILARYVIEVEPLAGAASEDVARLFEPALRALMDQPKQHN